MFADRVQRLAEITQGLPVTRTYPLLVEFKLNASLFHRLAHYTSLYILACLNATREDKVFEIGEDVLTKFSDDILSLPNLTPNGLLLPKSEVMLEYNMVQKCIGELFKSFNIDSCVELIDFPINVRVVDGKTNAAKENRPYSTTKLHSDIWAGEPGNMFLVWLPVLGDIANTTMEVFEPDTSWFTEFLRVLNDYSEAKNFVERSVKYDLKLNKQLAYVLDSFALHKTIKANGGLRVSLDLRLILRNKVSSDLFIESTRLEKYVSLQDGYFLGNDKMVVPRESLAECKNRFANFGNLPYSSVNAEIDIISISGASNYDKMSDCE